MGMGILDLEELKKIFFENSEVRLLRYYEPEPGIFVAESPMVIERALKAGYEPLGILICEEMLREEGRVLLTELSSLPIINCPYNDYKILSGSNLTNGMLCAFRRKKKDDATKIYETAKRIAVIDDVENPTNVGSIFRAAAALNMDAVLVTKGSADPLYRRAARVSMGNVFLIPWAYVDDSYVDKLKETNITTVAMALKEDSLRIDDERLRTKRLAIILGNEGNGLTDETISKCDYTVMLPMAHEVDSLNVAQAAAVAFWELGK